MSNPSKAAGTRYETRICLYLRDKLCDRRIERRALHGSADMGDLYGLRAHGFEGIVECKSYRSWSLSDLARWLRETTDERENAGAGFALLVVRVPNRQTGRSLCFVTLRDLARIALPVMVNSGWDGEADEHWVCMTLDEAIDLMVAA